jgi:hypothetical protein
VVIGGAKRSKRGGAGSLLWLQGLACGALAALAPGMAFLIGMLLAPGLLALFLDRQPGKPVARAVILFALAACVSPLRAAWNSGLGLETGWELLSDPRVIGTVWSAAGAGWLLTQLGPVLISAGMEATTMARAAGLRAERDKLAEEWGLGTTADQ